MHAYRTHDCAALRPTDAGQTVRLSGWVHAKRDHGGLLFIDLRDHAGITQIVFPAGSPLLDAVERVRVESVLTVTGAVVLRDGPTVNAKLPTGEVEVRAEAMEVQSAAAVLPMQVAGHEHYGDELRLRYRYLDLRRERVHRNMMLRSGRDRILAPAHDRAGLHRVPDADPDRVEPGGRPRLPGAGAAASGQVLRAAAGAAAVQAAADGGWVRPLLPDRAVLPRRGGARRPLPGRVLPARLRDELRDAGGRVRDPGAGDGRRVRGVRRRPDGGPGTRSCASPTRPRWPSTARTSPTCATRCGSPTSPMPSPAPASGCSPRSRPAAARCGRSRPRAPAPGRARSSTG